MRRKEMSAAKETPPTGERCDERARCGGVRGGGVSKCKCNSLLKFSLRAFSRGGMC